MIIVMNGWAPKEWSTEPRKMKPEGVWPRSRGVPNGGRSKISLFFPSPATIFFLSSLSWGSRGILVVGLSNVHVWSSRANFPCNYFYNYQKIGQSDITKSGL